MAIQCAAQEGFEISPRFRQTLEERIARLERDAAHDEAQLDRLNDIDHIRRQMRLVAVERAEALRMRIFLDRAKEPAAAPADRALRDRIRLRGALNAAANRAARNSFESSAPQRFPQAACFHRSARFHKCALRLIVHWGHL